MCSETPAVPDALPSAQVTGTYFQISQEPFTRPVSGWIKASYVCLCREAHSAVWSWHDVRFCPHQNHVPGIVELLTVKLYLTFVILFERILLISSFIFIKYLSVPHVC